MKCFKDDGAVKAFRRKGWKFQETFETPRGALVKFVGAIIAALTDLESARMIIEQVVFEPQNIIDLNAQTGCNAEITEGSVVEANGRAEAEALLRAALGDWVDFVFVPVPGSFAIYADHDEYMTLFSMRKSGLTDVVRGLTDGGFKRVDDYERTL